MNPLVLYIFLSTKLQKASQHTLPTTAIQIQKQHQYIDWRGLIIWQVVGIVYSIGVHLSWKDHLHKWVFSKSRCFKNNPNILLYFLPAWHVSRDSIEVKLKFEQLNTLIVSDFFCISKVLCTVFDSYNAVSSEQLGGTLQPRTWSRWIPSVWWVLLTLPTSVKAHT